MTENPIDLFARQSADPVRVETLLRDLVEASAACGNPAILRPASRLFGASRFLAQFSLREPHSLLDAVNRIRDPVSRPELARLVEQNPCPIDREAALSHLRLFRKRMILRIALRDILGLADFTSVTTELSDLADVLIAEALRVADADLRSHYGDPDAEGFAVIALGKLGGQELNFSSDVDLVYVYAGDGGGETSGIVGPGGTRRNRISSHEYYCKLGELVGKLLSTNTADGFVYRVDLRLRPEGGRGDIALSLGSYELYYESYGREWERAVLIRARPVAGDESLGASFMEMIRPFVFRKALDFATIDELRRMKNRIDSQARTDDIKRGWGGIREVEFFVQSFQLIYGGREPLLRERNLLKALHRLNQKGLVSRADLETLSEAYVFLRTLEHRLQMVQDLQTQTLPTDAWEREVLARNMGRMSWGELGAELEEKRSDVRDIFHALFHAGAHAEEPDADEDALLFSEEMLPSERRERLAGLGFRNPDQADRHLSGLRESFVANQTIRTRQLLSRVLPQLFRSVVESTDPDRAIGHLSAFLQSVGPNEAYLSILAEATPLAAHTVTVFAQTEHLSRILVANPDLLDALREQGITGTRTLASLKNDLSVTIGHSGDWVTALRRFRLLEEFRLGLLYLNGELSLINLLRALTKTSEAILEEACRKVDGELSARMPRPEGGLAIIGLGKLGGWEMTYGSDVDILFIHSGSDPDYFTRLAEKIVSVLTSYTRLGVAYKVDTRLRPTGSKGPLVTDVAAARRYYIEESELWERQALLRTRGVAGDHELGERFFGMSREAVAVGGRETDLAGAIRRMRERIESELSKEGENFDLKFGPGGLNELEFTIQYLQIRHARTRPEVVVPNTPLAIRRLEKLNLLASGDAWRIGTAYRLYREIETVQRLLGLAHVPKDPKLLGPFWRTLRRSGPEEFLSEFLSARKAIREIWNRLVAG